MWGIAEDWLAAQPSFEEVLERLRELRRLPEAADFRAFKCEQLRMFTSVIEPQQELMHLPDGRTLLLSISPHPFGGLTFVYEDVTDRLALERSCNTLTQVRRATLDHLFEGIAVYGSDGRLKLYNPAYLAIWGLSEDDVAGEPHIGDDRREDPRVARRWRRLDATEAEDHRQGHRPCPGERPASTEQTARCCRRRRCRFPTAMCC